jgi:hypothetical protein
MPRIPADSAATLLSRGGQLQRESVNLGAARDEIGERAGLVLRDDGCI